MKYSIELVPRQIEQLEVDIKTIQKYQRIEYINIPDLKRFKIRSWEPVELVNKYKYSFIPHLRSIDFNINDMSKIENIITQHDLNKILLVTGDPPQDMSYEVFPTSTLELCKKLKNTFPELTIYGAIDPYRSNIKDEIEYLNQKIDQGFDGFFSQPFFDLRLLEIFLEQYESYEIFWGVSPVTSVKSKNYWETRNRATFPNVFQPTLEWNINFAKQVIQYLKDRSQNIYFMPIKINLEKYLGGIFAG
ncbi:MAG: methylenetetrahydrofolate reductase [Spirochaetota bacterium]